MNTISESYTFKQIINKSIFICTLFPIKDATEANSILELTKKKYYDANHNCYAYIYGENGEYAKNSDDGEPSQTAGVVIYDVLKKNSLTNVLAIVTRYFGGIKLGAGGLIRAYSSSTSEAIKLACIKTIEKCTYISIKVNYNQFNIITYILDNKYLVSKEFDTMITLKYLLPNSLLDNYIKLINNNTKSQAAITILETIAKPL